MRSRAFGWCLGVALGTALPACASAHVIRSEHALNQKGELYLEQARGARPELRQGQLLVRYLRAGGVYFEWQGQALMTAPFASNYPLVTGGRSRYQMRPRSEGGATPFRSLLSQRIEPDETAIDFVLSGGMRLDRVGALLAGHSHYDHLGDVPDLMRRHLPHATLYANCSAKNMLAAEGPLTERIVALSGTETWISEQPLIRFRPIVSGHAPNLRFFSQTYSWAPGLVRTPWQTPLRGHELSELRVGTTLAFLIDFLDPTNHRVVFRVHYQDAASAPPLGYPPESVLKERDVDLEVVTLPGREALPPGPEAYPVGILKHDRAHHALVIHYESFFHPVLDHGAPNDVRLIDTLRGSTSEEFLDAVASSVRKGARCSQPELHEGMRADAFSVPLPGAWLVFDTALSDPRCQ